MESRPFQIITRPLTKEECVALGYDTSEIRDFPVMRMSIQGSWIDYEESNTGLWILYVNTEKEFRKQGRATYLMKALKKYADKHGKAVIHGNFTEDGEMYLKPLVKKLWPNYKG